jgi:hypothetical protein
VNDIPSWVWFVSSFFWFTSSFLYFRKQRDYQRARRKDLARRAIGTYLTTGTKTEALGLNPGSTIKAAEQHRLRHLKVPIVPFEAFCFCPRCGEYACHPILVGNVNLKTLSRVCDCGFMWKQWR